MKTSYLLPAVAAVFGFGIAWTVKPSHSAAPVVNSPTATSQEGNKPARPTAGTRPSSADNRRPKDVKAGDFPLADQAERGPKNRDEARMLRLTEALGLSIEQQGRLISLIEEVQASANGEVPVLQDLATRGRAIEEGLAALLTPEQKAKFEEIRVRERDNLIESRAQRMLVDAISEIDLSPEQRDEVLLRLRQKTRADMQAIPAAATLLFDKSILPTNQKELSLDGVLLLSKTGEQTFADNPGEAYETVRRNQRAELEEVLQCFDGILTPGQMGQYQAGLAETKATMDKVPSKLSPLSSISPPQLPPEPTTIEVERVPALPDPAVQDGEKQ
jgi:hypothetical protein